MNNLTAIQLHINKTTSIIPQNISSNSVQNASTKKKFLHYVLISSDFESIDDEHKNRDVQN